METVYTDGRCVCTLDERIYPLQAVMKTAYTFLDRCYVFLYHDAEGALSVRLRPKAQCQVALPELAGEFLNELLNESLRYRMATETRSLRELIIGRALFSSCVEVPRVELMADEQAGPDMVDPLGIGRDWFEQDQDTDERS